MDINTLKAFVAVAETGSFSLAAERIYLTQPAVSKRIAALETELGVKLFDRMGKTTSLNEAGRKLLPRAINMLQEMEDIQRSISNLSGDVGDNCALPPVTISACTACHRYCADSGRNTSKCSWTSGSWDQRPPVMPWPRASWSWVLSPCPPRPHQT